MNHIFQDEVNDSINDVSYGVEKIIANLSHKDSHFDQGIVILEIITKDNLYLLVRMSLHDGFTIKDYKYINDDETKNNNDNSNSKKNNLDDDILKRSFDSLPNLLLNCSTTFQQEFHSQLFQRLSAIQSKFDPNSTLSATTLH